MHRLTVNPGTLQAWEIQLEHGSNYVGRTEPSHFKIEDASVSCSHCEIIVSGDSVRIIDLGSTNGTFVDQIRVQEQILQPGQRIRLGSVEMILNTEAATARTPVNIAELATVEFPATAAGPLAIPAPAGATSAVPSITIIQNVFEPHSVQTEPLVTAGVRSIPAPAFNTLSVSSTTIAGSPPPPKLPEIESAAPTFCKNHFQNPARHKCEKCNRFLCDLCVNTRGTLGGGLQTCKICAGPLLPVSVKAHVQKEINFFQSIPQAFKYPFVGDGLILLICGAVFFGFLDGANYISTRASQYGLRAMTFRAVIITFVFGTGYLFSYLKNIVHTTASGDQKLPDWPEFTEWQADIVVPMFQLLVVACLSFGPALVFNAWSGGDYPWVYWLLLLAACFYFPMAMLVVAMFDTLAALNPLLTFGSILRVPKEYSVAAAVFAGVFFARWLFAVVLKMILPIPLLPVLMADLLGIYFLIVETRILGTLYASQKGTLGWFQTSCRANPASPERINDSP